MAPYSANKEIPFYPTTVSENGEKNTNLSEFIGGCRVVDRQFKYLPWNNPGNIISLTTQLSSFKFAGVFLPFVCILGMPVNIINCIVYCKLGLRDRVNLLLFSLACADFVVTGYLFVFSIEYFYMLIIGRFEMSGVINTAMTNSGMTSLYGASFVSGSISTLIACERCLCVVLPFKAKQILRTRTTAITVIVSAMTLIIFNYIISEKYKVGCEYIPALKAAVTSYYPSQFYINNTQFVDILNVIVFGVFLPVFFVLITSITTTITVVKLKGVVQWRQSTSSVALESKEIALTKMLITVSILFIVCSVPNVIIKITPLFVKDFRVGGRHQNLVMFGIAVLYCFGAINSTLNFFFYYKMGSRFRNMLKVMCCGLPKEGQEQKETSVMNLSS